MVNTMIIMSNYLCNIQAIYDLKISKKILQVSSLFYMKSKVTKLRNSWATVKELEGLLSWDVDNIPRR